MRLFVIILALSIGMESEAWTQAWLNRYTIESVKAQPLTDELFQIDPKMRVLTSEQMIQEANDLMK
ncbi:hypothetical protein [uncultured Fibrella sp.]|uniref:hypothetical protein n=1 Tax=uncultured Fibrella sp. TaxID=1284596 RepID=UPI0035CBE56F